MTSTPSAAARRPALGRLGLALRPLDRRVLGRMVLAGAAWGVTVSSGLTAVNAWKCGTLCLDKAAFDGLVTAAIGIVTIGPLAAFGRPSEPGPDRPG